MGRSLLFLSFLLVIVGASATQRTVTSLTRTTPDTPSANAFLREGPNTPATPDVAAKGVVDEAGKTGFDRKAITKGFQDQILGNYGPMNKGPLPDKIADTFRSSTYKEIISQNPVSLYRIYGGEAPKLGVAASPLPRCRHRQ